MRSLVASIALGTLLAGCGEASRPISMHPADQPPARLSDWGLFVVDGDTFGINDGVIPYELNTPLFTDYALKLRTVWMPEGESAWQAAEARLGVSHMTAEVSRRSLPSPFDYARQTRILIVHDLSRGDLIEVSFEYRGKTLRRSLDV